ncbi:MAG: asparaginase [Deltaproteobacteria bacterium]|nr:asparaginase [Deltaproteobacteria bacterium]
MQVKPTAHKSWHDLNAHYLDAMRSPWYRGLVELQDAMTHATYRFFKSCNLKTLYLPITTASISSPMGLGSDSKPVKIDLFGVETYLADSMQFMLEYGCRLHPAGCYYLMPSFRGEEADETHLCQFYHSEAEIPGTLADVMKLVENYVRSMTAEVYERCAPFIRECDGNVEAIERLVASSERFPQITVDAAIQMLGNDPALVRHDDTRGFRTLTRRAEQILQQHLGGFVWLTEPDHIAVPFYQAFADTGGRKAKAADLLFGLGEVVGCGERHESAAEVRRALEMHRVDLKSYEWYCKMREKFPMKTSGFGLGTERYLCWLLNHRDVRDCQLLPRFNGVAAIP